MPLSVETHTSPLMLGWTMTLAGAVEDPSVDTEAKVFPPSVDM